MIDSLELFPWNANFETGISTVDQQHQTLVGLINTLARHLASDSDSQILNTVFTQLTDYATFHFKEEEAIWQQYLTNHPKTLNHTEGHHDFINAIHNLQKNGIDQPVNANIEDILGFLIHWLLDHILESDMHMAKIVLALQSGFTLEAAVQQAEYQMSNVLRMMINTTRDMYNNLCQITLSLMKEKHTRELMEKKLLLAAAVFDNTLESICITDAKNIIISANPSFYQTTGYAEEEIIGQYLNEFKQGLNDTELCDKQQDIEHWSDEITSRNKNGALQSEWLSLSYIKNNDGDLDYCVWVFSNIAQLIENKKNFERIAHHDPLTGLPNRLLLTDRFSSSIATAQRNKEHFATCFLDLDGFKPINDTYSHAAGDLVLCAVAQRIKSVLRNNDTVARVGGDEFVLLLNNLHTEDSLKEMLDRLLTKISQPIAINKSQQVSVGASIGIASYPKHGTDMTSLLANADQAMYVSKQRGKSQYSYSTK
ncbi:MAG: bacteriohemerythrin [Methylococcaceae bacterium]|nr:bacteriohemerythrin [Methylococcaceae bacterium]